MGLLATMHRSIGHRPEYRQAFYDLEREGEVRGVGAILRWLVEDQALFDWQVGVRTGATG